MATQRTGDETGGCRELRANPFGNYSLLEAQQPARGAGAGPNGTAAPARESPFANYSFQEAQQNGQALPFPPPSPTASADAGSLGADKLQIPDDLANAYTQLADNASADGSTHSLYASEPGQHHHQQQQQQQQQQFQPQHFQHSGAISIEQYAIRTLYEEFRDRAAAKIDTIVELRLDREPNLAKHLDHGVDPTFDRTLEKLGMLARRRPRVIIELLLVWRKTTIDAADDDPLDNSNNPAIGSAPLPDLARHHHMQAAALSRAHYIVRERKSLVSVYILCRALSAVVSQLDASHLDGDLGDRLEELVFGQVKQVNPANLRRSQNRREIQDLYAQLIGRISGIRFSSMSDRFIAELERIPMVSSGSDERIVELLHNMRFIRLRVYPIDALEESSAFLLSCAKFYSRTSGSLRLKHAWATLLTELLMPIAAVVDVEVNLPELVQAIDIIYAKAMKMASKVRHVTVAFPLAAATLCISRREVFHQRWLSLLEYCIQRLKDKQFRRVSMDAILRMLWVYLFRYPEASNVVLRRIDSLSRIFFPATKLHAWPKTVPPPAFVYFLVCAACYNFEFTMRQLLQNMLQVDSGWPGTSRDIGDAGPILDTLNPARVALAFQALVSVAAIASNGAAAANPDAVDAIDRGSAAAAAAAAAATAEGAGQPAAPIRPPFPGVAQLSGLDIFAAEQPSGTEPSNPAAEGSISTARPGIVGFAGDKVRGGELAVIDPDALPENISNALTTAISVVSRYCSVLYPVFGHYILADERLWRQSCSMPLYSSMVLTGSAFSQENTALAAHGPSREHRASHGVPPAGVASGALAAAGSGAAGAPGALTGSAVAKSVSDEASDRHYADELSSGAGAAGESSMAAAGGLGGGAPGAAELARQSAAKYPAERQAYVDLMTVYMRNMPRAQLFWEQIESQKLIETLVHNVLHVDQPLAAESRACLLDLLCPPSMMLSGPAGDSSAGAKPSMFVSKSERLTGVAHAVVRATQLLRAVDERFSPVLVAGIFVCDARSNVSLAQPGDPLVDTPGLWPYCLPQTGAGSSIRRFAHAANLSTASAASNGLVLPPPLLLGEHAGRHYGDATSEYDMRDEGKARHTYSSSGQLGDTGDSDIDAGRSSTASAAAAAAAIAAALDAKARFEKSPSSEPTAHELNGGFLHVFLDLIHYLETSLHEALADDSAARNGLSLSAAGSEEHLGVAPEAGGPVMVGDWSLIEWAKLICAIEANAVAILCSSNVRVRQLAVEVLYQAGVLRRILAAYEPVPQLGHSWLFRNCDSAYETLNVMVPPTRPGPLYEPLISEFWSVPFGANSEPARAARQPQTLPLARAAASAHESDISLWSTYFPVFIRRASVQIPDVMLVARTLVCQRLYQMQPLMTQYSEVSVRTAGMRTHEAKIGSAVVRTDLVGAFGSLFLFAVVSLPTTGDSSLMNNRLGESASGARSLGSGLANGSSAVLGTASSSALSSSTGGSSRSRLAKSIARKLAPLKSTSRGSKQEQGAGLASIAQLVRVAGVILRSDNAPLRQQVAYALSSTPALYLHELMQELRPLADVLLDDGTANSSHRNYLHVSGNAAAASSSTGLLISSLSNHYHGLTSSPGGGGGVVGTSGGSPKASAQLTSQASKRRMAKAGSGSRVRDGGLGSDTEATSDSGTGGQARAGRRANSFDAAAVSTALNPKRHQDGASAHADPGASSASVAAAAAAAGVNSGTSTTAVQMQRRRRRLLRLSLAQIYKHVSRQLDVADHQGRELWQDEQLLAQLVAYIRETRTFLSESAVQWEWEHQPLRAHFCGLVEGFYYFISAEACAGGPAVPDALAPKQHSGRRAPKVSSMFTHETRNGLYQLFERWCSLGRSADISRETQARMIGAAVDQIKDPTERESMAVALDDERQVLERAALQAMAVLCRSGSVPQVAADAEKGCAELGGEPGGPREKAMLFAWVSDALNSTDPRVQRIGQHAVKWTILGDIKDAAMMRVVIQLAYGVSVASSINNGLALAETKAGAPGTGNTSGLGLMFSSGSSNYDDAAAAAAGGMTLHHALADAAPTMLANDRVLLGYLQALTAVLSPPAGSSFGGDSGASACRSLVLMYMGLVLPLVLFHLRSERRRIRRQALVLLRALCVHAAADVCLGRVDELGPSIVSDIPAIASGAVDRLSESVAQALAVHTGTVLEEVVRQVHVQGALDGRRVGVLRRLVRPWLANVELESARFTGDDDALWGLEPVGLSRDSVRVLRCMLYLTVRTGQDGLVSMQDLWMALVERGTGRAANLWLVVRHLTGLLAGAWSTALLGFARRITVFLSRSSQGAQLVRLLIGEAARPGAMVPLDVRAAEADAADVLSGEVWASDIAHLVGGGFGGRRERPLVSTGALAVFYLGAISYEQAPLLAEHRRLAVLAPVVFMLAHPERWVRDAARTVLVNLVAAERIACTEGAGLLLPLGASQALAANEAAHCALTVLRSDECQGGFGNVDLALAGGRKSSPESGGLNDSDEFLPSAWTAVVPAHAADAALAQSRSPSARDAASLLSSGAGEDGRSMASSKPAEAELGMEAADPSLVADVADIPAVMSQATSPAAAAAAATAGGAGESRGSAVSEQAGLSAPRDSADAGLALGRRQSSLSTVSRRSPSGEGAGGDGASRERLQLQRFVTQLSRLFGGRFPGSAQGWAGVAVQWAMSCPVRPLAGLALQMFGVLVAEARFGGAVVITPTRAMVLRLVDRLSNVVGDASLDVAQFAETVVSGLRQAAALAARMCADDAQVLADLLATSLVLMRTASGAGVYAMALSVFERMFRLAVPAESRFRELIAERGGALAAGGYQPALLRGLEFAQCRERCLALLRETLKYDLAAGGTASVHPMLALASHMPALIDDAVLEAAEAQRVSGGGSGGPAPSSSSAADSEPAELAGKAARGAHRHNYRRAQAAATAGLGSGLGLVFGNGLRDEPEPAANGLGSPRRQLFRRRGTQSQPPKQSPVAEDEEKEEVASTLEPPGLQTGPQTGTLAAQGMHARYFAFIEECSQTLLAGGGAGTRDMAQLVQRLAALLEPATAQQARDASREAIRQFGYAAMECGPAVAAEVAAVLLQFLQASGRMRVALRFLGDEQAAWSLGDQAATAAEVGGYAGELRRIDLALQLLHSVLTAGGETGSAQLRLDAAMAPRLRHLFDLLVVARPVSDAASRVLHVLLQRFDEVPPSLAQQQGQYQQGQYQQGQYQQPAAALRWYETDAAVLQAQARAALAGIVALGYSDDDDGSASDAAASLGASDGGTRAASVLDMYGGIATMSRSVSPEMPVLVIPDARDDEVRVERLAPGSSFSPSPSEASLSSSSSSSSATGGLLAELDEFDRELDAALGAS
ncbi:Cell morphogenesis protein PAG1 [Coemansia sp. RSA 2611]|nr:Cell morphogenesis protein PAG1 [Coemansia sp. RSA 2611]